VTELEPPPPNRSLADEVQQAHDLLENSDLFDAEVEAKQLRARSATPTPGVLDPKWRVTNVVDKATGYLRLKRACDSVVAKAPMNWPGAAPQKPTVLRPKPLDEPCASRELLSRAAQLYLREALEALVVLSLRRRHDEPKRLKRMAESDAVALTVEYDDAQLPLTRVIQLGQLKCQKRDTLLDAMLDHDILQSGPNQPALDGGSTLLCALAKASRARELAARPSANLLALAENLEQTTKRIKLEMDTAPPKMSDAAEPDVISTQDVVRYLSAHGARTINPALLAGRF